LQQQDHPNSPTRPDAGTLNSALLRNIEVLTQRRHEEAAQAELQERIADRITGFTGSMAFVYLHLIGFGFWITANLGWIPGVPQWDPSFVVLAMEASVEAIFLSTFVLISQNRMMSAADRRADLDLQINLLTEHEVTKLAGMVRAIAEKLDVAEAQDHEVREIERDVAPEAVLDVMDKKEEGQPG
jgi:uncharacterized membrane protein